MAKSNFDKKMEKISVEAEKFAGDVKDTAGDIGNRWSRSTTEEKITMIVGIILLVRGLIKLRTILRGVILLTVGLLAVSGFFDRPLRDLIAYCKKETSSKKSEAPAAKPAVKSTAKKASKSSK